MRHGSKVPKLKRDAAHRRALLANLACSLIEHGRIRTTLGKAKALRPVVDKLVTLGKRGDIHARRQAVAFLRHKEPAKRLFDVIAPLSADRQGGYTRIVKLGPRSSDAAPMAFIEFVDLPQDADSEEEAEEVTAETEAPAKKKAAAKKATAKKAAKAKDAAPEEAPAEAEEVTAEADEEAPADDVEEAATDAEEAEEEKA